MRIALDTATRRSNQQPLAWLACVAATALAAPAHADGPILHEYVPFDPAGDGELGAITLEGGFSAEIQTPSGKISAPDVERPITAATPLYSVHSAVRGESFTPDRDVRQVDTLPYDDPFRPSLTPFKRLVAFDTVEADYHLKVRDAVHHPIYVGKEVSPREPIDPFYADVAVELRAGEPIRIPTAIAGTIIKRAHIAPTVGFRLERDGAENLFIVADGSGAARLLMELEAPRDAFGGISGAFEWSELPSILPLPANVQKDADLVARELGIDKSSERPAEAIRKMVAYFRDFRESDVPPPSTGNIYLDLVHAKKGVCRHRAFAMMVTSLGLGIPTRFVHNEAHAWVEVHDGYLWRRVDLGGAGRTLEDRSEKPERPQPQYQSPTDPFGWPTGAAKGSDLVPPPRASTSPATTGSATSPWPSGPSPTPPSTAPASKLTLQLPGAISAEGPFEVTRSRVLPVRGKVVANDGSACKQVRVEIVFRQTGAGIERVAGVLLTDDGGVYDAKVTIPSDLALGDYTVTAHTPGSPSCGEGTSD